MQPSRTGIKNTAKGEVEGWAHNHFGSWGTVETRPATTHVKENVCVRAGIHVESLPFSKPNPVLPYFPRQERDQKGGAWVRFYTLREVR